MMGRFAIFPEQASTIAARVDGLTLGLLGVSAVIFVGVCGLILAFALLYREGSRRSREMKTWGQSLLEWSWTVATFFVFLGFCGWGAWLYFGMHVPPATATQIDVVAKQWMWKFQQPNGRRELGELHIPVGVPVVLNMTSEDVIHSLFIPEFRIKQDVLPGRYTRVWFQATRPGRYHLFCTQYCGTAHAGMQAAVVASAPAEYERWQAAGAEGGLISAASRGARLFTRMGCMSCHGVNAGVRAPALAGLFGARVGLSDGTSVIADEGYLRESILNPSAKITEGYAAVMPSFAGLLGEEEILDMIAYIKTLRGTPRAQAPAGPTDPGALPSPPLPPPSSSSKPGAGE